MNPITTTERLYRLESLHAAIICVEDGSALTDQYRRNQIINHLLMIAAEQTDIARGEVEQALDA